MAVEELKVTSSISPRKLFKRIPLTNQHKAFLIAQVLCFVLCIITVSLSGASLSIVRSDSIIKVFSVLYREGNIEEMSPLAISHLLILIGGTFTILFTIIGFIAAVKNLGTLLEIYIIAVNILFLIQSSSIVLSSNFYVQIGKELGESMKIHINDYYKNEAHLINGKLNFLNDHIAMAWDIAQFHFNCCGVRKSHIDFSTSPQSFKSALWNHSSIDPGVKFQINFPPSCCKSLSGTTYPFNKDSTSLGMIVAGNWKQCLVEGDPVYTHTTSCFEKIRDRIRKYSQYALGSATFNSAAHIISIITGLRLIRIVPN
ncbi:DgyrCDS8286 [Dimorphilus gyrociliatus]|uniref:DgyrCDS8286 n=1 Tax=Dimorphilus gyrociliatus TaxID=2664684 RepID=A0A7I8VUP5_9ANNE|nr:DgyrCDS8286 [Dimorphilus gyrociliatus]